MGCWYADQDAGCRVEDGYGGAEAEGHEVGERRGEEE